MVLNLQIGPKRFSWIMIG